MRRDGLHSAAPGLRCQSAVELLCLLACVFLELCNSRRSGFAHPVLPRTHPIGAWDAASYATSALIG